MKYFITIAQTKNFMMKRLNFNYLLALLFVSIGFTCFAQVPLNDTVECMHAIGIATSEGAPLDGAIITIFQGNEVVEWSEITSNPKHDHHFSYDLFGNSYYTVQVSKPGYVTRSISIDTKVPNDFVIDDDNPKTKFEFEVDVFKMKSGAQDEYLDFPIALVKFNKELRVFEFDAEYTKKIKQKTGQ